MSGWTRLYLEAASGTSRCHCQTEDEPVMEAGTQGVQARTSPALPVGVPRGG